MTEKSRSIMIETLRKKTIVIGLDNGLNDGTDDMPSLNAKRETALSAGHAVIENGIRTTRTWSICRDDLDENLEHIWDSTGRRVQGTVTENSYCIDEGVEATPIILRKKFKLYDAAYGDDSDRP